MLANHSVALEERAKVYCVCVCVCVCVCMACIAVYAAETWALSERQERLLVSGDHRKLR